MLGSHILFSIWKVTVERSVGAALVRKGIFLGLRPNHVHKCVHGFDDSRLDDHQLMF